MEILFGFIFLGLFIYIAFKVKGISESSQRLEDDDLYDIKRSLNELHKQVATRQDIKKIWEEIERLSLQNTDVKTDKESVLPDLPVETVVDEEKPVVEIPRETKINTEVAAISEPVTQIVDTAVTVTNAVDETVAPAIETIPNAPLGRNQPERIFDRILAEEVENKVKDNIDEDDRSLVERWLSANTLSKIGIITFVLGIAFFVKYAIDQNWINEIGRVGIGILTGAIIIGVAHWLKEKYHLFSSILVGGGISVLYITVTLAFQEYRLFGQTLAFVMVVGITVFSVILSLLYDRKELAVFSLLGGFAAPMMVSTGEGNYIVLFTYILILNTGMLVLAARKGWKVIGMVAYPLTLFFFATWLIGQFSKEYTGATIFASLFFVQFYLLALIEHAKEGKKISRFQVIIILSNNLIFYLALIYIFDMVYEIKGITTIVLAAINAVILSLVYKKSYFDRNLVYLLIGVVMTFASLAVPVQLEGNAITMFWAAETVILLFLWQKSRIKIFFIGFIAIAFLVVVSYFMDLGLGYVPSEELKTIIFNRMFITGTVILAVIIINIFLLKREDSDQPISLSNYISLEPYSVISVLKYKALLFIYFIPFLELNFQIATRIETHYDTAIFNRMVLATYTIVFIAVLSIIYGKKDYRAKTVFVLLLISTILYTFIYPVLATDLREAVYLLNDEHYSVGYFALHLLSLPAIVVITMYLARRMKSLYAEQYGVLSSCLCILSVITLSIEADNIAIMLLGNQDNYSSVLYDMHTFGYPILWGLIAFVLMVWGLKSKDVMLRKISLFGFGIIIIKFYAIDIWQMSKGGRIASFVILGAILLLASFLQQKIKILIKDDSEKVNKDDLDNNS